MVDRRGAAPREPLVTMEEARAQGRRELFERLEALLVETRGNVAEMARRLGKDRSTVRYHLRRFGMLGETRGRGARQKPLHSADRPERPAPDEETIPGEPGSPRS